MKGINEFLEPAALQGNIVDYIAYLAFQYTVMHRQDSLVATISQYPPKLKVLLGPVVITDEEGLEIMQHIASNNTCAGSDGLVKDGVGGHAFCITDNSFTN